MAARPDQGRELNLKFKVLKFLGKGSYGSVYQVQRLSDGKVYALKEMDVKSMSQPEREDSVNEIRLLASIMNHNVIRYHEAFLDGQRLCIIMELCQGGDLARVIKQGQAAKKPLAEDLIWKYLIQLVQGLSALHALKILHRDIKPGNVMVQANDVVKIGDLGIAKVLKSTMAKTQIGTPHYMPPEIWKNKPYSFSSDSWALGCALFEMMTYSVPFEARSMSELRFKVLRGTYPPLPAQYSRDLQQVVKECLDPNPDRRPTMDRLLAYPSFQQRMGLLPHELSQQPPSTAQSNMLATIIVPKDLKMMKNIRLPGPNYEEHSIMDMISEEDDQNQRKHAARAQAAAAHAAGARVELSAKAAANLPPAARAALLANGKLPAVPSRPVAPVPAANSPQPTNQHSSQPKAGTPDRPSSQASRRAPAPLQPKAGSSGHSNPAAGQKAAPASDHSGIRGANNAFLQAAGARLGDARVGAAAAGRAGSAADLNRLRQPSHGPTSANSYGAFYGNQQRPPSYGASPLGAVAHARR